MIKILKKEGDKMHELYHHGIKGQKWGVRRYQNKDGSLIKSNKKSVKGKYDISEGTTLYRADSDPTKKFMDRKYTYVNVTDDLKNIWRMLAAILIIIS